MGYKILLTGKNEQVIDQCFLAMGRDNECITTSTREGDVLNHFKLFEPEVIVFAIESESKADMMKFITTLKKAGKKELRLAVIGSEEACNTFEQLGTDVDCVILTTPATADDIKKTVVNLLSNEKSGAAPKKNILVIDDDPMMLRLIKTELKDVYSVATAVNGKIALDFIRRRDILPDLILLDYEMPEMNGAQVFERLRTNLNTSNIPIVFLTGVNDREKIKKVFALKPQGYLLKPIDCNVLIQTIKKIIG